MAAPRRAGHREISAAPPISRGYGEVAEWLKASGSKTVMGHWPIESSNLSLSASFQIRPSGWTVKFGNGMAQERTGHSPATQRTYPDCKSTLRDRAVSWNGQPNE